MKSRFSGIVASIILGASTLAAVFNRNITVGHIAQSKPVVTRRRPAFRTGIKGIKGTSQGRYGYGLQRHFDNARNNGKSVAA